MLKVLIIILIERTLNKKGNKMKVNYLVAKKVKENNLKYMDDDGSVIAGVILGLYCSSKEPKKEGERLTNDGRVTDKRTFICPKCDRGWEFVLHSAGSGSYSGCVLYSKNITRYKKQRKLCSNCKGDTTIEK